MSVLNQVSVSNLFINRVMYPAKNRITNRVLISVLVWNAGKLQECHRIGFSEENFPYESSFSVLCASLREKLP